MPTRKRPTHRLRWGFASPRIPLAEETRVCAYTIREFGASEGDELRDAAALCRRAIEGIGRNRDEVRDSAAHWKEAGRSEILKLRRVKNLLQALAGVDEYPGIDEPLRAEVRSWLELLPILP
jgi:hypothetical protein